MAKDSMHGEETQRTSSHLLREQMPVTQSYAYFDHAAVAPLPRSSADAICCYARQAAEQGDADWLSWSAQIGCLRDLAAQLISAKPSEIALVSNTTQGINFVAEGIPWKPGDNVVVPGNEFPSNLLPWRNLRRLGVETREVAPDERGEISLEKLAAAIDSSTRLLAISWIGFASGYRIDVSQVVELAHARGCLVMLDAIQGLGAFPLNVAACGVDFICADGHKWLLGPEGAGLLYIQEEHLNLLTPLGVGWNSLASEAFDPSSKQLKASAGRYEGGTLCLASMLGFLASLRLLLDLGAHRDDSPIAAAILNNVADLDSQLRSAGFQSSLFADERQRSGIVGISWPGADQAALSSARKHLLRQGIVTSVRGGRLRASPHAYNNTSDNQRLVEGLKEHRKQPQLPIGGDLG